jgi:hypothetical protein
MVSATTEGVTVLFASMTLSFHGVILLISSVSEDGPRATGTTMIPASSTDLALAVSSSGLLVDCRQKKVHEKIIRFLSYFCFTVSYKLLCTTGDFVMIFAKIEDSG